MSRLRDPRPSDAEILARPDTRPSFNHGQHATMPDHVQAVDIRDFTVLRAGSRSPRNARLRIGWCPFCGRKGEVHAAYVYARARNRASITHRGYVMRGPLPLFMTVDSCTLSSEDEARISYGRKPTTRPAQQAEGGNDGE